MKNRSNLFSSITFACLLVSTSAMHCSQAESQKKDNRPLIHKALGLGAAALVLATIITNPFHVAQENLPTNPIKKFNNTQTIDQECFGFSIEQNGGTFVSDVYGRAHTNNDLNEIYAQDAIADIKAKHPDATIHWYDCRYYNHKPYNK